MVEFGKEFKKEATQQFFIDSEELDENELIRLKNYLVQPRHHIWLTTHKLLAPKDQNQLSNLVQSVKIYVNTYNPDSKNLTLKGDILKICEKLDKDDKDSNRALETNYFDYLKDGVDRILIDIICQSISTLFVQHLQYSNIKISQQKIEKYLSETLQESDLYQWSVQCKIAGVTTGLLAVGSAVAGIVQAVAGGVGGAGAGAAGAAAGTAGTAIGATSATVAGITTATTVGAATGAAGAASATGVASGVVGASIGTGGILAIVLACAAVVGGISSSVYVTQGWNRKQAMEAFSDQLSKQLQKIDYEELLINLVKEAWSDVLCNKLK